MSSTSYSNNKIKILRRHSADTRRKKLMFNRSFSSSSSKRREELDIKIHLSPMMDCIPLSSSSSSSFSKTISFRLNSMLSDATTPTITDQQSFKSEVYHNSKLLHRIHELTPKLHVDFSHWHLVDQDIPIIVKEILRQRQCNELWLYGNHLSAHGASLLALGLVSNTSLKSLDLSYNHLSNLGIWSLTQSLVPEARSSLKVLFLTQTGITNEGAFYLADMLKSNQTLTELWLSDNEIGVDGFEAIIETLTNDNRTLKLISFSINRFLTDLTIDLIVNLFEKNSTLTKFYMKDCNLSEEGKRQLRSQLSGHAKVRLEL